MDIWFIKILPLYLIIVLAFVLLNVKVSTLKGVNCHVLTLKIPLYLKILNFFDRHYNYKVLVNDITSNITSNQEKVNKIFKWVHQNIKKVPEGFPVIDDHVWHIIVRGYGTSDQFLDVFTTLCNYAGLDALYLYSWTLNKKRRIPISFVKINNRWVVFEAYKSNVYFYQKRSLMKFVTLGHNNMLTKENFEECQEINYYNYLENLPLVKHMRLQRANNQSPLRRFSYGVKKILKII